MSNIEHRDLIGLLLTYPHQADRILQTHQKSVDSTFIQLLRKTSLKMTFAGNHDAAVFLQGLASRLQHNLLDVLLQIGEEKIAASNIIPRLTKYKMLPQLIKETIIDRAIAEIECSPQEIASAIEKFAREQRITNESEKKVWCDRHYICLEEFTEIAIRPLKIAKFKLETWGTQVETYFHQQKDKLDRVSYSIIRLKDPQLAERLYVSLINKKASFAELARKYSQGLEAQQDGLVDLLPLTMPHPKLVRMLKMSRPGQLWRPVWLGEWIIIVRLEKLIPARLDRQMRRKLIDEMFANWLAEQMKELPVYTFSAPLTTLLSVPQDKHFLPSMVKI